MIKKVFIYCFGIGLGVLGVGFSAFAKSIELRGAVLEAQSQKPVKGVKLYLEGTPVYVSTDEKGTFYVKIPEGSAVENIRLEKLGYQNYTLSVEELQQNQTNTLVFSKNEFFLQDDGWVITLVGMAVIFFAIFCLFFTFKFLLPLLMSLARGFLQLGVRLREGTSSLNPNTRTPDTKPQKLTGEMMAAIGLALHQYWLEEELHDDEQTVMTIEKTTRHYSPWSSKIYSTYQLNRKI